MADPSSIEWTDAAWNPVTFTDQRVHSHPTPCYRFNDALTILERAGKPQILDAPEERRRGSFAKCPEQPFLKIR
jgi:protein gp37